MVRTVQRHLSSSVPSPFVATFPGPTVLVAADSCRSTPVSDESVGAKKGLVLLSKAAFYDSSAWLQEGEHDATASEGTNGHTQGP